MEKKMKRLVSVLLVLLLLVGCGGGAPANNPKSVAQAFLNALRSGDAEKVMEMTAPSQRGDEDSIDIMDMDVKDEKLVKEFTGKFFKDGFKVTDVTEEGDSAVANITFSAPKMGELMGKLMPVIFAKAFDEDYNALTEEEQGMEMMKIMTDSLKDATFDTYESKLHLIKEDDKWYAEALDGKNEDMLEIIFDDFNIFDE